MALVRVRIKAGNKVRIKNMGRALAEASENVEILEGEPTSAGGRLLKETFESGRPIEPPSTVEESTAKKAVTASAPTKKENDR